MEATNYIVGMIALVALGFTSSMLGGFVGGAGLFVTTGLVFSGLSPQLAVGTSRFGGIGSLVAGIAGFGSTGKTDFGLGMRLAVVSSVGAIVGVSILADISDEVWGFLSGGSLVLATIIVLSKRDLGLKARSSTTSPFSKKIGYLVYSLTGLWVGLFGGGGAIIANLVLLVIFGQTFLEAAGTRKIPSLAITLVTFAVCASHGMVDWASGIPLFIGMSAGSYFGAKIAVRIGDVWLRRAVVSFLIISLLHVAWKTNEWLLAFHY